jgi:site-specific DNA-cytosine methylase
VLSAARLGRVLPAALRPTHLFGDNDPHTMGSGRPYERMHVDRYYHTRMRHDGVDGGGKTKRQPTRGGGGGGRAAAAAWKRNYLPANTLKHDVYGIGGLPPLKTACGEQKTSWPKAFAFGARPGTLHNHWCMELGKTDAARAEAIKPGRTGADLPEDLIPKRTDKREKAEWYKNRFGRLTLDGVAATITAQGPEPSHGSWFHPDYANRRRSVLTVRECARLQTFPDHFVFVSGHGASDAGVKQSVRRLGNARATRVAEEYRMVGNAVPPLLATRVGDAFLRANFSSPDDDDDDDDEGNGNGNSSAKTPCCRPYAYAYTERA